MRPRAIAMLAAILTCLLGAPAAQAGGRRHHPRPRVAALASPQWQPTAPPVRYAPRPTYPTLFGLRRPYPPPFEPGPGLYRGTLYRMPVWSPFAQMGAYGNTYGGNLISPNLGPFPYGW
jgi:hypothetical protein